MLNIACTIFIIDLKLNKNNKNEYISNIRKNSHMRSEIFVGINQTNFTVHLKLFQPCAAKLSVGTLVKLIVVAA